MDRFPPEPLRQYALLADGERGALIGPRGDISFLCLPRWHDAAVFSSLIGGTGHYAVTPEDARFVWGGSYEEGTLIWRSRWVTTHGIIECREALMFPGNTERAVVLRQIRAVDGEAAVHVVLQPSPDFGAARLHWTGTGPDTWEGQAAGLTFRWSGAPTRIRQQAGALDGRIRLRPGQTHDLVLEVSPRSLPSVPVDAQRAWAATYAAWADEEPELASSLAPTDVRHSNAVLRGLTSSSGGMVAAATMSLPERAEQGRNYDYRYAWIRDQCYAGQAAAVAGALPLLDSAVDFVSARLLVHGPDLKPAYTVEGGAVPSEERLDLAGYPGGTDKVGNHVNQQFQLDSLGEALLLLAAASKLDRIDSHHVKAAQVAIDAIDRRWQQPDAGIWELEDRRWAHSRLMCAAGLRQWGRHSGDSLAQHWDRLADALLDDVRHDSLHPSGRWQRAPDDPRVDAALLLPALRGAVSPADPATVATWRAVREELAVDGYVYRFRQTDGPLHDAEGAFLLCGFHMALATQQQSDPLQAVRWFERTRAAMGPPGLFTEEFDVVQRQLRGNVPQAFVHALLMESAVELARDPAITREGGA